MAARRLGEFATVGIAVLVAVAGCSAPAPPAAPTYQEPPRTVRPDEVPLRLPQVTEDDAVFTVIGLTTGMPTVAGSHAEFPAKGAFSRVRLVVSNVGRSTLLFDTRRQQLITADGAAHSPDDQAMTIKRQPDKFPLGANVRLEFDLYYDIPPGARPSALRVFGGGSLSDQADAGGTDIPLS